jgi:hypothetical protein
MTGINRQSMNGYLSLQANNKMGLGLAEIMSAVVAAVSMLSANNGLSFSRNLYFFNFECCYWTGAVNVELSLDLLKHHAMKTH